MRRRPAWLGGPGKDADGAVLLTGPEAGELLKAAVGHAGEGSSIGTSTTLTRILVSPRRRPIRLGCSGLRGSEKNSSA